ncbi:ankyrin repeat-containing protein BDA1-like [Impatiens glandulifera]|uniref:ankyrin repeat-containing protein BDA1-like n=1 Tax=Impatiens glandulifera TaxID=253017 RepID=UPI001FB08830|nr:ankyrin repeat-containing protein BDA1-like [Impatiens glandulifera]
MPEQDLYQAAVSRVDINSFRQMNQQLIMDVYKFTYFGYSILHVAVSNRSMDIVEQILETAPDLLNALDSRKWSPLHLASVQDDNIVMMRRLLHINPYVARVKTSHGDSILHLCLKNSQPESLQLLMDTIQDTEFANLTDAEGNTILHLAVMLNSNVLNYLLEKNRVKVNAKNAVGNTALDIALECTERREEMIGILKRNGAWSSKHVNEVKWLSEKRNVLIVLASLTATMTFQAGVNPPGGTWQDNSGISHRAGEAVMAYNYSKLYTHFLSFNTIALMGSLITILLLLMGLPSGKGIVMKLPVTIMWFTILVMIFTYTVSITMTTPKGLRGFLFLHIAWGVVGFGSTMAIFRLRHRIVHFNEFICGKIMQPHRPAEGAEDRPV